MDLFGKSVLQASQFGEQDLIDLFELTDQLRARPTGRDLLPGKILASLFWEPSTRTRFSFETAMLRLGGQVISNADMERTSSIKKHESLYDTAAVISQLADIIVIRHPVAGLVGEFDKGSNIPVLNAGDGIADHPSQGLLDIYTIYKNLHNLNGLTIGMVGDLKHSRVVHAQCELLKFFKINFVLVSPLELRLPEEIKTVLRNNNCNIEETEDLNSVIADIDVLSNTRIQEERFNTELEYQKFRGVYQIDLALLSKAKNRMIILDPLPRVDSLLSEIDTDPRAKYFEQVQNGVWIRMALIYSCLFSEKLINK